MPEVFTRDPRNPILRPRELWWEGKGVLNPGAVIRGGRVILVYRAVGNDGISRFGLASSSDGQTFERPDRPLYEAHTGDTAARLGIEDPRITPIGETHFLTFTKVSVESADKEKLVWETAPFRLRSWIAQTKDFFSFKDVGPVLPNTNTKDLVLFPGKVGGRFVALIREYPSIRLVTSPDLHRWSEPQTVIEPAPGGWEAERVGAGPPPIRVGSGWLVLYHANEYVRSPGNSRMYRMGLALLDGENPGRVLYRHPEPVFQPRDAYESEGPVGNVVFGTGLLDDGESYRLYYGAADGVIGLATAARTAVLGLLPTALRGG